MEIDEENLQYAFLLGSALRNEDANKFLEIYDVSLPKDIPQDKVSRHEIRSRILFESHVMLCYLV